jgi:hypothetical protein
MLVSVASLATLAAPRPKLPSRLGPALVMVVIIGGWWFQLIMLQMLTRFATTGAEHVVLGCGLVTMATWATRLGSEAQELEERLAGFGRFWMSAWAAVGAAGLIVASRVGTPGFETARRLRSVSGALQPLVLALVALVLLERPLIRAAWRRRRGGLIVLPMAALVVAWLGLLARTRD